MLAHLQNTLDFVEKPQGAVTEVQKEERRVQLAPRSDMAKYPRQLCQAVLHGLTKKLRVNGRII